jgi:DNA-directed RNA polymerase specialized sigma54-like protein
VVDYERLEAWKRENALSSLERRRLRQVLKKIELINMRQDILFQILSRITTEQSAYLRTRLDHRCRPLSLREVARRIGVAPSTVSRAVGSRSAQTPWGEEVSLKSLMTSQRSVILAVLSEWRDRGGLDEAVTDERLMRRLATEAGITVSRRTVNECRRKLLAGKGRP